MIQRLTSLFALWTVLGTAWAWLVPEHFLWVVGGRFQPFGQSLVSVLLGVIMLGMGITLSLEDFRRIAQIPKCVGAGVILQFTLMPLAGILIASGMALEAGLAVGLILVSCCPGGTASNVVAYLARANLALSVTMTMASTLIAVIATPLLTGWLAGKFVEIDRWSLFVNMVSIVLIPVVAGVALNRYFPRMTGQISKISPLASVIVVVLIIWLAWSALNASPPDTPTIAAALHGTQTALAEERATIDVGETLTFERVLVVESGKIVEDDVPTVLAAKPDSRYRALLDAEEVVRQKLWSGENWRRLWLEHGQLRERES